MHPSPPVVERASWRFRPGRNHRSTGSLRNFADSVGTKPAHAPRGWMPLQCLDSPGDTRSQTSCSRAASPATRSAGTAPLLTRGSRPRRSPPPACFRSMGAPCASHTAAAGDLVCRGKREPGHGAYKGAPASTVGLHELRRFTLFKALRRVGARRSRDRPRAEKENARQDSRACDYGLKPFARLNKSGDEATTGTRLPRPRGPASPARAPVDNRCRPARCVG